MREVLRAEVQLSARGPQYVPRTAEARRTKNYRNTLNSQGSPSEQVAADYVWEPGTELASVDAGDVSLPTTLADENVWRTV